MRFVERDGLGVVVELDLDDGVPAVLAHEAGARGGVGDGLAVVVLRASVGEVGLALFELGAALLELGAARLELLAEPGDRRVVGVRRDELVEEGLPAGELELALAELRAAGVELALAVLDRGRGRGDVGCALVELGLRLEGVGDALDVRHLGPRREHVLDGACWASVNGSSPLSRTTVPAPPAASGISPPSRSRTFSNSVPGWRSGS